MAETLAWVLMPNHFHFLLKTKEEEDLHLTGVKPKPSHRNFSNLFNAYAKALNKRYKRHGALFEIPFQRKLIEGDNSIKNVLVYIHNNPVNHEFCQFTEEYPWSSYLEYLSDASGTQPRNEVIE